MEDSRERLLGWLHNWNTKALEGFAAAHPELLELRTEKMAAPSVRIIVD
jgi:hypothetical protein